MAANNYPYGRGSFWPHACSDKADVDIAFGIQFVSNCKECSEGLSRLESLELPHCCAARTLHREELKHKTHLYEQACQTCRSVRHSSSLDRIGVQQVPFKIVDHDPKRKTFGKRASVHCGKNDTLLYLFQSFAKKTCVLP